MRAVKGKMMATCGCGRRSEYDDGNLVWGVWCTPTAGNSAGKPSWLTDSSDRGAPRIMTEAEARSFASSANLVGAAWTYEARRHAESRTSAS